MPTFEIEQYEIHGQTFRVEADSEAQAIKKLFEGKAEPVDNSLELIEVANDLELPADNCPDLARALRELGIDTDDIIPSIREIREVS
jgi:hypothetical protein